MTSIPWINKVKKYDKVYSRVHQFWERIAKKLGKETAAKYKGLYGEDVIEYYALAYSDGLIQGRKYRVDLIIPVTNEGDHCGLPVVANLKRSSSTSK